MSILLGFVAALAWGIHDLCVRQVSKGTGIFASIVTVLTLGCIPVIPVSAFTWSADISRGSLELSVIAGVLFGLAAIAHYKAFSIGPVRLVAPIIGAYPALSVGWAMATGTPVTLFQWAAVALIIAGIGYVAGSGDEGESDGSAASAIFWSVLAGSGFALTFAVGQAATAEGFELALQAPTRVAALVTVLAIALIGRVNFWPGRSQIWILAAMGALDAVALGSVISAGRFANPELASVVAATFGLITILLAAIFLRERVKPLQWIAVLIVFGAIAYLAA